MRHRQDFSTVQYQTTEIMKYDVGSPKVQGAVENLPFRSESIDNVVYVGVLRHCFEPSFFISEAFRVLKPGGRLLISTPGADWPKNLWLTPWGPLVALSVVERWGRQFAKMFKRRRDDDTSSADSAGVVYDRRFTMDELLDLVQGDFQVVEHGRSGVDFPSSLNPPKWLIKAFYLERRLGRFLYTVCVK